jgi:hypothetical protein
MSASSGAHRNGAVVSPQRPSVGARPELRTRVRARLRRSALDRLLAAGEPPWASRELSWRATELSSRAERRSIADQIEGVADEVMEPPRPRGAAAPLDREGVRASRQLLLELADDLRGAEAIRAQGVALLRQLLRDGGSPLYSPGETRALRIALLQARAALLLD